MANGFLSQLAAARSAQQALGGLAGLQVRKTGFEEQRALEDEIRRMEERRKEEVESARKREGRRGRGRLFGSIAGGLLTLGLGPIGTAIGAGLGSLAGQEVGSRYSISAKGIEKRKRRLGRVKSQLEGGMFHSGWRKDIGSQREDLNRFLRESDKQFDQLILSDTLSDALSAFAFAKTDLGKFARSTDPEGKTLGLLKGYKAMKKADKAKLLAKGVGVDSTRTVANILGKKLDEDLGIAMFPDYMGEVRDAYKEMFADRSISFGDFLGGIDLPGQGFGQFFDAGGQR